MATRTDCRLLLNAFAASIRAIESALQPAEAAEPEKYVVAHSSNVPLLNERQRLVLQSLRELRAFNSGHLRSISEIASKALGGQADENQFKPVVSALKKLGLRKPTWCGSPCS
jgi:hypothetical protein